MDLLKEKNVCYSSRESHKACYESLRLFMEQKEVDYSTDIRDLYQDGTELELVSRILGHSSTETPRIYAVPSIEMMRKAMETGSLESDEKPLWTDDETEMARICGLR